MDIRQPHIPSTETERLKSVIDAKQVQHRGVQVVHLNFVLHRSITEFVGCTVNRSSFDSASGHPDGKAERIVIPTIASLCKRRSTKFPTPDNQRLIEQTSLFQVMDQCCDWFVDRSCILRMTVDKSAVLIPTVAISPWTG